MSDKTDKKIVELARPLINEELHEIVDNYAKGANKDVVKILQSIQKVVDNIWAEMDTQGKDLTQNTTNLENLRTEFNAFRNDVNQRDKRHNTKVEDIVKDAAKETIKEEVPKAVIETVEPIKHKLIRLETKGIFARIRSYLPYAKRK